MRLRTRASMLFAFLGGVSLLVVPLGSAADAKDAMPEAVYTKLSEQSVEVMRTALKGEVRPRAASKARTAALMLAAFAQQDLAGKDGQQRVTVRDAALDIVETIGKKDYAAALQKAEALPTLKADPKAKKDPVALELKVTYADLMTQYREPKAGGLGIEDRLDSAGHSPDDTIPAKELNDTLLLDAYRSVVVADLIGGQKPKRGDVKEWQKLSDLMRKQSLEVAIAVQAKDGKASFKAVNALNRTCDKCHQVFRKDD